MFDKNFYPTPESVIKKMLKPFLSDDGYSYNLNGKIILEPSAGKGDIVDFIEKNTYHQKPRRVDCIEKDNNLQAILRDKRHNVVDTDFLEHHPDFDYNLIIMNPPFDNGAKHILKAWDILNNGDIICLLNEATIKNPCDKNRELLKNIIEENGEVEFLETCFDIAERKTNVRVALVRLHKQTDHKRFEFNGMEESEKINIDDEFLENGIATTNIIRNICVQYEQIKKDYIEMMKYQNKIKQYAKNILDEHEYTFFSDNGLDNLGEEKFLNFVNGLKRGVWNNIIKKTNIEKYMTSKVRNDFSNKLNSQHDLAITEKNIYELVEIIFKSRGNILENSIVDVFDIFTKYHKDNRLHVEGWKTNDSFKVNKKIILPYWVKYGSYMSPRDLKEYGDTFSADYREEYGDIDKALCYISGFNFERITGIKDALQSYFQELGKICSGEKFDNTCESTFFNIKFFKKGTIHITFKDDWLWEEFNMRACAGKNWLPEGERKAWEEKKEFMKNNLLN